MKYLPFYDVGLLAMLISVIEFVSMLQLGLLNGGFRMYFVNTPSVNRRINSMLFSYFGILWILSLVVFLLAILLNGPLNLKILMIAIGAIAGTITLAKTWCSNLMIAAQKLRMLNKLNIWSTLLSFPFILLVPKYGLPGSVALITIQPVVFVIAALWFNPELRPHGPVYKKSLLRKLMLFGFVPFLAGILLKVDDQVERWGIIDILGIEVFGKYNLVLIYCSVFMLVPASINPIFFLKAIAQYRNNNLQELRKTMLYYILTLFSYTAVTIGLTVLLLPYLVNLLLPKYNIGVRYVWYILPYVFAQMFIYAVRFSLYVNC